MKRAREEGESYLHDMFTDDGQPGSVVVKARDAQDWTTLKQCHEALHTCGPSNRKRRPTRKIFEVGDATDSTADETVPPAKTENERPKGPRPPSIILHTYGVGHNVAEAFSWDTSGGSVTQPYVGQEDCENKHRDNRKDKVQNHEQKHNQDQVQNQDQDQNLKEKPKQEQKQESSKPAQNLAKPEGPTQALPEIQDPCSEDKITENESMSALKIHTPEDVEHTQGNLAPAIPSATSEGPTFMLEEKVEEVNPTVHQLYGLASHILHLTVAAASYLVKWLPGKQDLLPQNLTVEDGEIEVDVFLEDNNLNEISIDLL